MTEKGVIVIISNFKSICSFIFQEELQHHDQGRRSAAAGQSAEEA